MNLALWAIAGLLALVALTGGVTKVSCPGSNWLRRLAGDGPETPAPASSRPSACSSHPLRSA